MATIATPTEKHRDWRTIMFRILAGLLAMFFLVAQLGLPSLLEPWVLIGSDAPGYTAELHRMHEAHWGTIMVFFYGLNLLVLAWRPRGRPLLVQFVLLAIAVAFAADLLVGQFDPIYAAILFVCLAALAAAYPSPRDLLRFSRDGPLSQPLFGLSLLAAALLAPDAWRSLHLQLASLGGEHAAQNHWILTAELELMLVLGGLLAAAKRPGWRVLGVLVGLALVYLGLASISAPHFDGSWGTLGGALATLGGWGFVGATLWEARKAGVASRPAATGYRRWLPYAGMVLAAALLEVGLVASTSLSRAGSGAAPAGQTILSARDYQFDQPEIHAQAGETLALWLDNRDGAAHQFDVDEFNVHVPMPVGQGAVAQFTPTQPGTYTFYCALHVDLATKQGMAGKLVVTP